MSAERAPEGAPNADAAAKQRCVDRTSQLDLWNVPTARRNDPATSHAAATEAARKASATEDAIVNVLRSCAHTTDEIAAILKLHPPSVGTAISRLSNRGLVRPIGERLSNRGRPASVWALTDDPDLERGVAENRSARRLPRELKVSDLLCDGRVVILERTDYAIVAKVRGYHGTYTTSCDENGHWSCTCAAGSMRQRCTHVDAVALVVGLAGVR